MKKILDIGCGRSKTPGAIGIDIVKESNADVIHNLDEYPYPFSNNEFDEIICNHIMEHIADVIAFIEEIHRIAKAGAIIKGKTPHCSSIYSYADPTHKHHFSCRIFEFFSEGKPFKQGWWDRNFFNTAQEYKNFYTRARFEIIAIHLIFSRIFRLLGVQRFANHFLDFYECYLMNFFPSRDICFELRVLK